MKKKFTAVYDYGMGGVWFYFYANSPQEITDKYPALKVVEQEPTFNKDPTHPQSSEERFTFDIDSPPTGILAEMLAAGMGQERK